MGCVRFVMAVALSRPPPALSGAGQSSSLVRKDIHGALQSVFVIMASAVGVWLMQRW